ncbi:FecR family protein [Winogradskyella arenosi]|uniref:FecR family protein n=1 Tax=Winogradskyella arenosi TaxID=533325 RepID=A0A368ZDS3_9FLAO|nr:FecR domain-containing protein [Winogradskyella arenosi]RCW90041.1 FecR family protein [Winogradskyella arenosi]
MTKERDILKWFNDEISSEEIKRLYPDEDFSVLEKSRFYTKQFSLPELDEEKALADFKARQKQNKPSKVVSLTFKTFFKVAAVLVVMLGLSYALFFNDASVSYSTEIAQTETFNLPDDSEVILNAKSELRFNKKTWASNRNLNLDGEAFFKVTQGKTFTVETSAGAVQVLGTEFNVKEREDYFEVTCYEGSVSVTHNTKKTILTPGKTFRVVKGEVMAVTEVIAKNPAWIIKESNFNNVPLWQVIDELEIQYGITILANAVDTSQLYTGSFTHNDRSIALQSVTIPLKLSYKIKGNTVEFYNYESH